MADLRVKLRHEEDEPLRWHYVDYSDDPRTFCGGWVWWDGQEEYDHLDPDDVPQSEKFKGLDKITCLKCRAKIQVIKDI